MRAWRAIILSLCLGAALCARAGEVSGKDVDDAVAKAVAYLKKVQQGNGAWAYGGDYDQGATALVLLGLLTAGVPKNDPVVEKGLKFIKERPNGHTYSVALTAMALALADATKYKERIQNAADWLIGAQNLNYMWSYGISGGHHYGDASNTQIAVLGLGEAEKAGAKVPEQTWKRINEYYTRSQGQDGGWAYSGHNLGGSSLSMSAAGVASLFIVQERMFKPKKCGEFASDKRLTAGMNWIAKNLSNNAAGKGQAWQTAWGGWGGYSMYAVERAGILSRQKYFGEVDWYKAGANYYVPAQAFDGSWSSQPVETAFGLLFLAKGKKPLLVSKLHWDGDWNNNLYDVENLVKHVSQDLRAAYDWHTVRSSTPLKELLYSPVLFISGHKAPRFKEDELQKLRQFMEEGGFIFAEACCGSKQFDAGFRALVDQLIPAGMLEPLAAAHPVYRAHYQIDGDGQFLEGVSWGCKTTLVYSPAGISCQWDGKCPGGSKGIKRDLALKVGTNVVVFGMGNEPLKDRLAQVALLRPEWDGKVRQSAEAVMRGALVWAQVQHKGDCQPDPNMWPKLLESLRKRLNLSINAAKRPIALESPDLRNYPLLYMVGHHTFKLKVDEEAALRSHLQRGGLLIAESCCGRKEFDEAFRAVISRVLPDSPLELIKQDHALLTTPFPVQKVRYREGVRREKPELDEPRVDVARIEGRIAVAYSRYGLGCPIDGHPCGGCKAYEPEDALKLMGNLVMNSLSGTAEMGGVLPPQK